MKDRNSNYLQSYSNDSINSWEKTIVPDFVPLTFHDKKNITWRNIKLLTS